MATKTYAGVNVEVTDDGYLTDPSQWNKDIAAEIAKEEGFPKVATAFKMIAKVEAEHEKRYLKLLQNISEDKVFMKDGKVWWVCMVCGYTYESSKAMENCPACLHPQSYMKLKEEDY